ncbi:oligosaccharide flippase family protein [Providencia rettgeri]
MSNPLYSAIKRSVTGKLLTYIVQFFALAIYARIFTPEQFGVIASIQVFVIFFQLLADVGIGPAIINEEKFTARQRDGIFSITLILGLLLGVLFYSFSYALNAFYNGYKYQEIALVVSLGIVFNALSIVPLTSLNKDAAFLKIAKVDCLVELISLAIVYFLHYLGVGLIALAIKSLSQALFRFIFLWFISKKTSLGRPKLGKELYHIKKIAGFASYQFGFNLINYFSRNLDKILIGKYISTSALGVYEKSYQLMQYPLMLTTFAMTPAIQPILTKARDDIDKIVNEHNKLTSKLLILSILISVFIYFNASNIVLILFGKQWSQVIPLIEIFSFMIPIQAVMSTSGSFFQVMNKPKLLFISGLLSAISNVTAISIGVYLGNLKSISLCLLLSFSINFIQCYWILFNHCFQKKLTFFLSTLLKSIYCITPSIIFYISLNHTLKNIFSNTSIINLMQNIILALFCITTLYIIKKFIPIK